MIVRNAADEFVNADTTDDIREIYSDKEQWRFVPWRFNAPSELEMQEYFEVAYANNNDESLVPNGYKFSFRQVMSFIDEGDPNGQGAWTQRGPGSSSAIILHELKPAGVYYVSNRGYYTGVGAE